MMFITQEYWLKKEKERKIYHTDIYVCVKDDKSNSIESSFNSW
jgi:hypothetical protein